jgi:PRTRC genetic system ThiF family protein
MKKSTTHHNSNYVHFTAKELLQPYNPVTVNLIGAGGTGSQMLTALARTSQALTALGHPGLFVRVFDDDKVERANLARQLFTTAELKQYKSAALISRINRFFGTNWKAVTRKFDRHTVGEQPELAQASLTLSCVDTVAARFGIAEILKTTALQKTNLNQRDRPLYLMDFGNSRDSGQVILSTIGEVEQPASKKFSTVACLPDVTEEFGDLLRSSEQTDHTPSCSLADALRKQDLFVNTALTGLGASLLWQFFREGMLFNRGFFMNLHDLRVQPLSVASAVHQPVAAA